jgi:hypothetical protein
VDERQRERETNRKIEKIDKEMKSKRQKKENRE